jgi:ATP-dependent Zn protease
MPIGKRITENSESVGGKKIEAENTKGKEGSVTFSPVKPRFSFSDVILPKHTEEEIHDLMSLKTHHDKIYQEWGLARTHKGQKKVAINLYGPPGTGKTITAHAIADYLGKDIIEVNYADVESKYVGETPKNLTTAFQTATRTESILFFDEADAILSRRVTNMQSSTDTSVNQTRSVMLMLLNNYDGTILFATNFIENFDPAFMRRVLGHIRFDMPDMGTRERLWRAQGNHVRQRICRIVKSTGIEGLPGHIIVNPGNPLSNRGHTVEFFEKRHGFVEQLRRWTSRTACIAEPGTDCVGVSCGVTEGGRRLRKQLLCP